MQNILVTGGAGFIGSNFIHLINKTFSQIRIVNLDLLTYAGSLENLEGLANPGSYQFYQGDICDKSLVTSILENHAIDTIVHFAAETHVDRSIHNPNQFIQTNIIGTYTLLEAARHFWLDQKILVKHPVRFHHISTDEVFGSLATLDEPFNENTPYDPHSPYAASKAASDHIVRSYFYTYNLPITISNCSNNYGYRQFPEKLIPLCIISALKGKSIPVYGDGQQIRDWLFVEDHCEAIVKIILHGKPGASYNLGGNNQPTNIELISRICAILDEKLPDSPWFPHFKLVEFIKDRPGHDRRYAMNNGKSQQELAWQPDHLLDDGLRKTIDWYLNNQTWCERVQKNPLYQEWILRHYT